MTIRPVSGLIPGDIVDLEGHDQSEANAQIWPFEYAVVESVSITDDSRWAIVYNENGACPALVPATAQVEFEAHREPFAGADALDGA